MSVTNKVGSKVVRDRRREPRGARAGDYPFAAKAVPAAGAEEIRAWVKEWRRVSRRLGIGAVRKRKAVA